MLAWHIASMAQGSCPRVCLLPHAASRCKDARNPGSVRFMFVRTRCTVAGRGGRAPDPARPGCCRLASHEHSDDVLLPAPVPVSGGLGCYSGWGPVYLHSVVQPSHEHPHAVPRDVLLLYVLLPPAVPVSLQLPWQIADGVVPSPCCCNHQSLASVRHSALRWLPLAPAPLVIVTYRMHTRPSINGVVPSPCC